jgi:hypothetical protein
MSYVELLFFFAPLQLIWLNILYNEECYNHHLSKEFDQQLKLKSLKPNKNFYDLYGKIYISM